MDGLESTAFLIFPPDPWPGGLKLEIKTWDELVEIMAEFALVKEAEMTTRGTQVEAEDRLQYVASVETQTCSESVSQCTQVLPQDRLEIGAVCDGSAQTDPADFILPTKQNKTTFYDTQLMAKKYRANKGVNVDTVAKIPKVAKRDFSANANMNVVKPIQRTKDTKKLVSQKSKPTQHSRGGSRTRKVSLEDYKERRKISVDEKQMVENGTQTDEHHRALFKAQMDFLDCHLKRLKNLVRNTLYERPSKLSSFTSDYTTHITNIARQLVLEDLGQVMVRDKEVLDKLQQDRFWEWTSEKIKNEHRDEIVESEAGQESGDLLDGPRTPPLEDLSDGDSGLQTSERTDAKREPELRQIGHFCRENDFQNGELDPRTQDGRLAFQTCHSSTEDALPNLRGRLRTQPSNPLGSRGHPTFFHRDDALIPLIAGAREPTIEDNFCQEERGHRDPRHPRRHPNGAPPYRGGSQAGRGRRGTFPGTWKHREPYPFGPPPMIYPNASEGPSRRRDCSGDTSFVHAHRQNTPLRDELANPAEENEHSSIYDSRIQNERITSSRDCERRRDSTDFLKNGEECYNDRQHPHKYRGREPLPHHTANSGTLKKEVPTRFDDYGTKPSLRPPHGGASRKEYPPRKYDRYPGKRSRSPPSKIPKYDQYGKNRPSDARHSRHGSIRSRFPHRDQRRSPPRDPRLHVNDSVTRPNEAETTSQEQVFQERRDDSEERREFSDRNGEGKRRKRSFSAHAKERTRSCDSESFPFSHAD